MVDGLWGRFALSHRLEKVSVLPIVPTPPQSATAHDWELTYPCMALLRIIHALNDEHFTLYPAMAHRLELMRSEDMAIVPASLFASWSFFRILLFLVTQVSDCTLFSNPSSASVSRDALGRIAMTIREQWVLQTIPRY
jgi:hypothetical protein